MRIKTCLLAAAVASPLAAMAGLPAKAQVTAECAGIGEQGRAMAENIPHTLKLVYAQPDGSYLGAVTTRIARGGEVVVNVTCPGPWLLANLPGGTYEVSATFRGQTKTRRVTVSGTGRQQQVFTF